MALRRDHRPVTEDDYKAVRRLASQGKGRNEIATALGRSGKTISRIAATLDPPVTFDRTRTRVATEARMIDAKARRAAIIERLYTRVEDSLARLEAAGAGSFKYTTSTGQGIDTVSLDHVPGQEEKAIAAAIGQYLTQATRLEALDGDPGLDAARSMLGALAAGVQKIVNSGADEDSSLE